MNLRAPGGSTHAIASVYEVVKFLLSLPPNSFSSRIYLFWDSSDEIFSCEPVRQFSKVHASGENGEILLSEWNFPYHRREYLKTAKPDAVDSENLTLLSSVLEILESKGVFA
ncbi:MAG: hypothetical protein NZO16_00500 [Deltaproteobacteria bacterium]|nr:hypothetical protein [Deltaproteobacteria bacterium]